MSTMWAEEEKIAYYRGFFDEVEKLAEDREFNTTAFLPASLKSGAGAIKGFITGHGGLPGRLVSAGRGGVQSFVRPGTSGAISSGIDYIKLPKKAPAAD